MIKRKKKKIINRASRKYPNLILIGLKECPIAESEHRNSCRQYMHTGHVPYTICYSKTAKNLDLEYIIGLIVHEIGHIALLNKSIEHNENDANTIGHYLTDIPVIWSDDKRNKCYKNLEKSAIPKWLR